MWDDHLPQGIYSMLLVLLHKEKAMTNNDLYLKMKLTVYLVFYLSSLIFFSLIVL